MADFSAADVKRLRDSTGVGMMDAKKALVENDGDFDRATKWLLEKGLAKSAERADRENNEGAVALGTAGRAASLVQLKSETDFVAKSPTSQSSSRTRPIWSPPRARARSASSRPGST